MLPPRPSTLPAELLPMVAPSPAPADLAEDARVTAPPRAPGLPSWLTPAFREEARRLAYLLRG